MDDKLAKAIVEQPLSVEGLTEIARIARGGTMNNPFDPIRIHLPETHMVKESFYRGVPLTELSREELIKAVEELGRLYQSALDRESRFL